MHIGITGGSGFIGKYLIKEFLVNGDSVTNLDLIKYASSNKNYSFIEGDAKKVSDVLKLSDCEVIINLAAQLGGIAFFNKYPATLLIENERIQASVFEAAHKLHRLSKLKKIIQFSSSMVYENTFKYPSEEGDERAIPPPSSSYGFQKLASEYYCYAFYDEFKLPYVIIRPFNAIGIGEDPLADSHVIPQFIYKALIKQLPFEILGTGSQIRVFTHAKDISYITRKIALSDSIINTSFNISNEKNLITMLALAEKIWQKVNPSLDFKFTIINPYKHDVEKRIGSSEKIRELLGWQPETTIDESLDEIIEDVKKCLKI